MPSIEPPDYTGLRLDTCVCGRCTIGDEDEYDDFSLGACLSAVQEMFSIVEYKLPQDREGAMVASQTLSKLIAHSRMLVCMRRQTMLGGA
jgi:hypothetical protein